MNKIDEMFSMFNIGEKGSGKTTFCRELLQGLKKSERALILDINDEYLEYPLMPDDFIINTKIKGIYRIKFNYASLQQCKVWYKHYLWGFTHGLLICETPEIIPNGIEEIRNRIVSSFPRHLNIVVNVQSFEKVSYHSLLRNINYINLFSFRSVRDETYIRIRNSGYLRLFEQAAAHLDRYRNVFCSLDTDTTLCGEYKGLN